jgi:amidase
VHDFPTALQTAAAIRAKELSPSEALEEVLRRVEERNPGVNAVIWADDDDARARAHDADDLVVSTPPDELPPFCGVPLPIKDLNNVAGWPNTYGSHGASDAPRPESDLVVTAFERGGFTLAGRTNTPEFGPITAAENVRYGISRNPWSTAHTPGGSSGGAAAAVASGMYPIAHANDGGGSIRIPAACCGLVGLKVGRGRVPVVAQSWEGASVEGVVSHTLADTAAVLDLISGPDRLGWWNAPAPERPFAAEVGAPVEALRVAVLADAPLEVATDPACVAACEATAAALEAAGHHLVGVVPDFDTVTLVEIACHDDRLQGLLFEDQPPQFRQRHATEEPFGGI